MRYAELDYYEDYSLEFLLDTYKVREVERLIKEGDIFKIRTGVYRRT